MLDALHWNVRIGQSPKRALPRVRSLAAAYEPHVFSLNEARRLAGRLDSVKGYRAFQLPNRPDGVRVNEDASTAVLIRDDVEVLGHRAVRMRQRWKHKRPHDPRVYHVLRLRLPSGEVWRVAVVHYPPGGPTGVNARAWDESARRMNRQLRRTGSPSLILGDVNAGKRTIRRTHRFATAVFGSGVDLAITRRCVVLTSQVLRRGGSDHPPLFLRLLRTTKP